MPPALKSPFAAIQLQAVVYNISSLFDRGAIAKSGIIFILYVIFIKGLGLMVGRLYQRGICKE